LEGSQERPAPEGNRVMGALAVIHFEADRTDGTLVRRFFFDSAAVVRILAVSQRTREVVGRLEDGRPGAPGIWSREGADAMLMEDCLVT
jgi:hypothetical protein